MNKSIRMKMVARILPVVLVVFVASIAVTFWVSSASQKQEAYTQVEETARHQASAFDSQMQAHQAEAETLASTMLSYNSGKREEVENILHQLVSDNTSILATYVGYEPNAFDGQDSKYVNQPGHDATGRFVPYWNRLTGSEKLEPLTDYDTSDYYQLPKKTKTFQVIEPYLYQGVLMASFVAPIVKDGQFAGIAGLDVSLANIDSMIGQIKVFDTGYAFLVSHNGTFVAFQDKSLIGTKTLADFAREKNSKALESIASHIANGEEGNIETTDPLTGKDVVMFYTPVATGNWGLVMVVPTAEMLASVNRLTTILVGAGVGGLILVAIMIFLVATSMSKPIVRLKAAVERIATGDLDVQVASEGQDEIGQMSAAFSRMLVYLRGMAGTARNVANGDLTDRPTPQSEHDTLGTAFTQMIESLRELVGQVAGSAADVQMASGELASAAEQAGTATGQVTSTIQQVAQGAAEQASSASQVTATVDDMGRQIEGIAHDAETQAEAVRSARGSVDKLNESLSDVVTAAGAGSLAAQQASETAQAGARTVQEAIKGIEAIRENSTQVSERVREMGKHSEEIGQIISTIQDIADQTNLLALNAAIEAARAGEQGRGFAVVADEVRKLAEKSSVATRDIANLIRTVQKGTEEAIQVTQQGDASVKAGVEGATAAGQALAQILAATEQSNLAVTNIRAAAGQIQALASQVVSALEVVTSVGEKNAKATRAMTAGIGEMAQAIESVASTAEENSASVEEVSATAEELSAQVEEVSASAQELASLAEALRAAIEHFKLDEREAKPAANVAAPGARARATASDRSRVAVLR